MFSNWMQQIKEMGDDAIKYVIIYDTVKLVIKVIAIKFFIDQL